MTTEEIKNLIDQKIAGQGSMVDVGGALPTILKEIVDMAGQGGGGDVKPIVLSADPSAEMTTQAQLDAIGLTIDEFKAAAQGKRNAIVSGVNDGEVTAYPITGTYYEENGEGGGIYRIVCAYVEYTNQGAIDMVLGWFIQSDVYAGEVTINRIES